MLGMSIDAATPGVIIFARWNVCNPSSCLQLLGCTFQDGEGPSCWAFAADLAPLRKAADKFLLGIQDVQQKYKVFCYDLQKLQAWLVSAYSFCQPFLRWIYKGNIPIIAQSSSSRSWLLDSCKGNRYLWCWCLKRGSIILSPRNTHIHFWWIMIKGCGCQFIHVAFR